MPVGPFQQLSQVAELIVRTNPKSILDVGVGFGTYGVLAREYLDLWDTMESENFYRWTRRIDGIEIFEKYLTPLHNFIYDRVFIGNASEIVPKLERTYDVALLMDVIEHLEYNAGSKLLDDLLRISRNVIVSTPKDIKNQGAIYGNHFETHLSQWSERDFQ